MTRVFPKQLAAIIVGNVTRFCFKALQYFFDVARHGFRRRPRTTIFKPTSVGSLELIRLRGDRDRIIRRQCLPARR